MTIRRFLGISLLAVVAGCSQTDKPADLGVTSDPSGVETAHQQKTQVAVVQGSCPQVFLRESTAVLKRYGKGAKDDPQSLAYQVTLADTTRQCVLSESQLVMTVMVQGRLVVGPAACQLLQPQSLLDLGTAESVGLGKVGGGLGCTARGLHVAAIPQHAEQEQPHQGQPRHRSQRGPDSAPLGAA